MHRQVARLMASVAVCMLLGIVRVSGGEQAPRDLEEMRAALRIVGASQLAAQVAGDPKALEAAASGVASGRHEWLDVGVQLVDVAPPYVRERLILAFSQALEVKADAVLERAHGIPVHEVCGYDPLTPMSSLPPCKTLKRLLAPRQRQVTAVSRPDLAESRGACLAAITRLATYAPHRSCRP